MTRHFIPVGVSAVIGSHSAVVLTNAVLAVLGACVMMLLPVSSSHKYTCTGLQHGFRFDQNHAARRGDASSCVFAMLVLSVLSRVVGCFWWCRN